MHGISSSVMYLAHSFEREKMLNVSVYVSRLHDLQYLGRLYDLQ